MRSIYHLGNAPLIMDLRKRGLGYVHTTDSKLAEA